MIYHKVFIVYWDSITFFSSKLNKTFVVGEVFWLIFQSLNYSIPLSISYSNIVLVNLLTKSCDLTQALLPTQQINNINIGFILGRNFWLTSHKGWQYLAYIKWNTRSEILIFHDVFMYPCVITLLYAKYRKKLKQSKFDISSRL